MSSFGVIIFYFALLLPFVVSELTSNLIKNSNSSNINSTNNRTGCQAEFHHRCHCGNEEYEMKNRYVTICNFTNFERNDSLKMLTNIPIDTEILIFTGNNLETIPKNLFGTDVDYNKLEVIDLSNNGIKDIDPQAFRGAKNVRKLVLNNNKWEIKAPLGGLFSNMQNLEELYLNNAFATPLNDAISTLNILSMVMDILESEIPPNLMVLGMSNNSFGPWLHAESFCSLASLQKLILADNLITKINWNVTRCLPKLKELDLRRNKVPYLWNETMDHLDQLLPAGTLLMDNNTFECDCNMIDFHRWLHTTDVNVPNKDSFVCADGYPENNFRKVVMELPEEMLLCNEAPVVVPSRFGLLHVVLLIVVLVMCMFIVALLLMNRKTVRRMFKNSMNPVTKRMQYSAISKENEREVEL